MNIDGAWLDGRRLVGDPTLDDLVAEHLSRSRDQAGNLLRKFLRTSRATEDDPLIAAALRVQPDVDVDDRDKVERGQRLFDRFGPEILLILGSYALPLAYASGNGVQAVYRAGGLKDPIRRLCDTAQMVINSMQPGQLEMGGVGWRSIGKVRLIHALVRHHLRADATNPWSMEWGIPINQEDQAGTLMTFSIGVLDGLRRMGAKICNADADAYIFAWAVVGRLLGIEPSLIPTNEAEAVALAMRIGERQLRPTPEGKELNERLLAAVGSLFPVKGYAVSLTHFFLRDTVFGADVASILQLPEPNWTKWLVKARAAQKRIVLDLLDVVPGARRRRSFVARHFAQAMILLERPDCNVPFEVPDRLVGLWRLHGKGVVPP